MGGVKIYERERMPVGKQGLMKGDRLVWVCDLGDPIEDVDFDGVILNPEDFARLAGDGDAPQARDALGER